MSVRKITPYIHFNGAAEKAIRFYESALGANVAALMRYSDGPCPNVPPEQKHLIMHSELRIGDALLLVSDAMPGERVPEHGNVQIMVDFAGPEETARVFDALAEGGTVVLPLHDAFWGAKFGAITDAFGVRWLLHCAMTKSEAA